MKISAKQYSRVLFEITDGKSEQEALDGVVKFAEELRKNSQTRNVSDIIEKYSELYNATHGIVEAVVTSSFELSKEQINQLEIFIKEKYSAKKVEIQNRVDKKIRGGIIIKVGDEIIDGSVENNLRKLKNILSK